MDREFKIMFFFITILLYRGTYNKRFFLIFYIRIVDNLILSNC